MCSASCKVSVSFGCQGKRCGNASSQDNGSNVIIWIAAIDMETVHLFLQRPGQLIKPLSVGCCCDKKAGSLENLATYLGIALEGGDYTGLVLVGPEPSLETVKGLLNSAVHNRVIAEIVCDIAGMTIHEVTRSINTRIML